MDLKLEEASLGIEVLNPRQVPILVFILCCLGDTKIFAMVCNRWLG